MLIPYIAGDVIIAVFFLLLLLELRRGRDLLQWTDDRDREFARLFQAAWKLVVLPKDNPLENFKQHGMLAKDAFMRADVLIPALDERLGVLDIGLNAVTREAKALKTWEEMHPAPPKHFWQSKPKPPAPPEQTATSVLTSRQLGA